MRGGGKCVECPWRQLCRAIKSQELRLQNLELLSLKKSSFGAQSWPAHSDRFSKAESTNVVCFVPERKKQTSEEGCGDGGLWQRSFKGANIS